jgi:uncharacterized protein YdeI (YjbR/CyaY-like superfamily)
VDARLKKAKAWVDEMVALRAIALDCPLAEELKWGWPCYTLDGRNVVLIHTFKSYCALLFMKGALLKDPKGILIQQTENSQSARQLRFTNVHEIRKLSGTVKAYIHDAIAVEKAGLKVAFKPTSEFDIPAELQEKLDADADLKAAFHALTPGRQRAYLLHIAGAKQSRTRAARVAKCTPKILAGKGLHD